MAAPTNIDFASAIDIAALPYDVTQADINDGGVNYTVYYKLTAPVGADVIGAWGYSGNIGAGYRPTINVYDSSQVSVLGIAAQNIPIQFPVTPGQVYYLEFVKNANSAGPESLRIRIEVAPTGVNAAGNIVVNDDTPGFPCAILSQSVDHTVINFVNDIAAGEAGDILTNGVMALEDSEINKIKVYDSTFSLLTTINNTGTARLRACRGKDKFYLGQSKNPVTVYTISSVGVLSALIATLTGNITIESLAADETETTLYFANTGVGVALKRWNLTLNSALTDLVAAIADYRIPDILVLTDGSIVVLYHNPTTKDVLAKRYDSTGAVLNTYNLGAQTGTTKPRMAYAADNPTSFWVWTHGGGLSTFRNVKCSDGSILTTRIHTEYEGGAYLGAEGAAPTSRFGCSYSCPFFIMMLPAPVIGGIYYIHPEKTTRHDSYYEGVEKKIPNPTFRLAFIGD